MKQVIVCINHRANPTLPSCAARGSRQLADSLEQEIRDRGLDIHVTRLPCLGRCEEGPNLKLSPGGQYINHVTEGDLEQIMAEINAFSKKAD